MDENKFLLITTAATANTSASFYQITFCAQILKMMKQQIKFVKGPPTYNTKHKVF